jgi:hypothetical protein
MEEISQDTKTSAKAYEQAMTALKWAKVDPA